MGTVFLSPESAVKYAPSCGYIIFFPPNPFLMKKARTGYELFHKVLFKRVIKVLLLSSRGKKIILIIDFILYLNYNVVQCTEICVARAKSDAPKSIAERALKRG